MKGDLPQAAFRLLQSCTVRTHERPAFVQPPTARGNKYGRRPVIINGVHYESIRAARTALGIGYERFYEMLDKGKARYA